ncbi:hypothetical protein [Clostridium cuniculi]|uniref:hypothetical protein n=1 Tax=Clostridium cuniculi TaxID=2548455 RepID=UPI001055F8E7|nr:hypothetical protein [Clostridium cuniculi]
MKIIIDKNIKEDKYILQLGDLVEGIYNDRIYVVTYRWDNRDCKNRYLLWSLDGDSGYNGYYDTLEDLTYSLVEDERIFKASEYELRLVKKGE